MQRMATMRRAPVFSSPSFQPDDEHARHFASAAPAPRRHPEAHPWIGLTFFLMVIALLIVTWLYGRAHLQPVDPSHVLPLLP